ncbi:hypothetical protein F5Y15DRAFT_428892 [Xylariaceae sp. FL0016]|nr:hypothetical protein F5Y15DRAFT_428892 [Xylariaceae sp. FL0016]
MYNISLEDDDYWCDVGNVLPWGIDISTLEKEKLRTGIPQISNRDLLTEMQLLQLDEVMYGGFSDDDDDSALHTLEYDTSSASRECLPDATTSLVSEQEIKNEDYRPAFRFLDLPLEIRHEIYHWTHLMHPVTLSHLPLSFSPTTHPQYPHVQRVIIAGAETYVPYYGSSPQLLEGLNVAPDAFAASPQFFQQRQEEISRSVLETLLSSRRPLGRIPTALLAACSCVYDECRGVSFAESEFLFPMQLPHPLAIGQGQLSGVWAARGLMRGLAEWQRGAMRYVSVSVYAKDLGTMFEKEWMEVCGYWKGIKGLRMKIVGDYDAWGVEKGREGENEDEAACGTPPIRSREGNVMPWIRNGLGLMKDLRFLELELDIGSPEDAEKRAWFESLGAAINQERASRQKMAQVVCLKASATRTHL